MNLGAIAVQAIKEWNPFGPEAYARRDRNKAFRKVRRKARRGETLTEDEYELLQTEEVRSMTDQVVMQLPDGSKVVRSEPMIKARTSTKLLGVGSAVLATTAAAVIPNWDVINAGLMAACQSEYGPAVGLGGMAAMLAVNYFTARIVKSPAVPGAL